MPDKPFFMYLDPTLKPVLEREMEVYAAIVEHTDHHSGRVIDVLITLYYDGKPVGSGRVEFSQAMIFSADETTDVGYGRAGPSSAGPLVPLGMSYADPDGATQDRSVCM